MKKITLKNTFHSTTVNVRVREQNGKYTVSKSQARKIINTLCGVKDCTCGTVRGDKKYTFYEDNNGNFFVEEYRTEF